MVEGINLVIGKVKQTCNYTIMLYFLVLLVPFLLLIWYLLVQNNKHKRLYNKLVKRLHNLSKDIPQDEELEDLLSGFKDVILVTETDIKLLEQIIHRFQILLGETKSKSVANSYGLVIEKIRRLALHVKELEEKSRVLKK